METAMKIRGWILGDGRSIHSVARETEISRTTIKKYLKKPEQPRYQRQQPRVGSKLNALTLKPDHPMGVCHQRRNASVDLVAILNLLQSKHCSKETGTKTGQDQCC